MKSGLILTIFLCEIDFSLSVVDFRDGAPVRLIEFDAMRLHPSIDKFIITLADILELVKIIPRRDFLTPPASATENQQALPVCETRAQSRGREDPLKEGTATHHSILAWRIQWTEEPGGLLSLASQSRTRQSDLARVLPFRALRSHALPPCLP